MGRKTTFSQAIADKIVEHLEQGIPLEQICRMQGMPKARTVYDWRDEHPEFAAELAAARAVGFDHMAADCITIADDSTGDMVQTDKGLKPNPETAQRAKLRIETRLKLLAIWARSKYGEHVAVQVEDRRPGLSRADQLAALQSGSMDVSDLLGRWTKPVEAIEEPKTVEITQTPDEPDFLDVDI